MAWQPVESHEKWYHVVRGKRSWWFGQPSSELGGLRVTTEGQKGGGGIIEEGDYQARRGD